MVDRGVLECDGVCVGRAAVVAALGALGLRQGVVDALFECLGIRGVDWVIHLVFAGFAEPTADFFYLAQGAHGFEYLCEVRSVGDIDDDADVGVAAMGFE